ncbi:MAG: DUF2905 family protein [Cytophagaceae bacterium]
MNPIGKILIILGVVLLIIGLIIGFNDKLPFGKLPGDMSWKGKNWQISFPLGTTILLSILLTLILYVVRRFF